MNKKNSSAELVSNRKAHYNYEILETYEAGIVLKGTEIKSLRDNGGSLQEGYIKIIRSELWLIGSHIAVYKYGNVHNHEEKRDRKLLMHKREIEKLRVATQEKGLAIVPLSLYLSKGRVKIRIGLARGKKAADKRETIKERDEKRYMDQVRKEFN